MKAYLLALTILAGALALSGCATPPEAEATAKTPAVSKDAKDGASSLLAGSTDPSGSKAVSDDKKPGDESKPVDPEAAARQANAPAPVKGADKVKDGDEVAVIETAMGRIVFMFRPDKAPKHVDNFKMLAKKKFYDGTRFHRCIEGFMIQGGDPNSKNLSQSSMWGQGGNIVNGKEVNVELEPSDLTHSRGVVSMARSQDPNSASSQFFIVQKTSDFLDGKYSAFGTVLKGMDVVDKIIKTGDAANNGAVEPEKAVVVKSIRIEKWPVK